MQMTGFGGGIFQCGSAGASPSHVLSGRVRLLPNFFILYNQFKSMTPTIFRSRKRAREKSPQTH
ncbi:MAG: hypothetical protein ACYC27_14370 [Armatimonadota bacterium]